MFWYKPKFKAAFKAFALMGCVAGLQACKPDIKETGAAIKYFDLKGFFAKDAANLQSTHPLVYKTVTHNGIAESKKVVINKWPNELDLFVTSDINKPAWRNSYHIIANGDFLIYKAKDPELKTREILIKREKEKVRYLVIFNKTHNILYQTIEKLTYYPDSLYIIEKDQHVKLMGTNHYKIEGKLLN